MTGISIGFDDRTARNDAKLFFGTSRPYSIQYNSATDQWELTDEGAAVDVLRTRANNGIEVPSGPLETNQETFLGQTGTPSSVPSGTTAFYTKSDGNLYKKPSGGTEEQLTSGSGSDTRVETQDSGVTLYTDTSIINLDSTTGLTVTDNTSGKITVGADRYTDEEAQDSVGLNYDTTMAYDDATPSFGVASGGITATEIAAGAVGSSEIASGGVSTAELASAAVTLPKIDASAGSGGQYLRTGGTAGSAAWQDLPFVTVGGGGDYASIQAAHDGETSGRNIVILPDYAESNDTFPISVTKKHRFIGTGNEAPIDLPVGTIGFSLDLTSAPNEFPGNIFYNLGIINGDTAVEIVNARYTLFDQCLFEGQASHAVIIGENANTTVDPVTTMFFRCVIEDAGAAGVNAGVRCHGLTFDRCTIEQNSNRGVDLDSGANIAFLNTSIQLNGLEGIHMGSVVNCDVMSCYLEDNNSANTDGDIEVGAASSLTIQDTYFQGFNNKPNAIHSAGGGSTHTNSEIRGCYFNNYTGAAIDLDDSADCDIYRHTHTLDGTPSLVTATGTRTRSHGVIIPQDLSTVTGQNDGDRAIDDGTNTTSGNNELAVWDSSLNAGAGGWFTQQGDVI